MKRIYKISAVLVAALSAFYLTSCAGGAGAAPLPKAGPLGTSPSPAFRSSKIASEPTGDFYYGRRYFVNKTRFWGYLRRPGQQWNSSKLVMMNESSTPVPDRLPENGPRGKHFGFDQNYEYKVTGSYTGRRAYDPNTDLFFPEFRPTSFKLIDPEPGWIFSQNDYYDPSRVTLRKR